MNDLTESSQSKFDSKFWLLCFAVIGAFCLWNLLKPSKAVLQNVPATTFVLPKGCNPADVRIQPEFRSQSPCFVEENLIANPEKYNFFRSSGSRFFDRKYYRFYDKAVHLVCDMPQRCQINYIHDGVFTQKNESLK
jgi:hypothetical protein